jgi:hypothetical protein
MTRQASLFDFPTAPPAPAAEQRVLPIRGTIQERYEVFRATDDGRQVWEYFCRHALEEVAAGAKRLSAKELVERIRFQKKISINNSYTALLARDCEADHPVTRGLFERRERKAS